MKQCAKFPFQGCSVWKVIGISARVETAWKSVMNLGETWNDVS